MNTQGSNWSKWSPLFFGVAVFGAIALFVAELVVGALFPAQGSFSATGMELSPIEVAFIIKAYVEKVFAVCQAIGLAGVVILALDLVRTGIALDYGDLIKPALISCAIVAGAAVLCALVGADTSLNFIVRSVEMLASLVLALAFALAVNAFNRRGAHSRSNVEPAA